MTDKYANLRASLAALKLGGPVSTDPGKWNAATDALDVELLAELLAERDAMVQAQPAAVSDEQIRQLAIDTGLVYDTGNKLLTPYLDYIDLTRYVLTFARAILALRPQAESEAPTIEAAHQMGAKGGPAVEAERLAFEAWMAGHCWNVSPTWNGQTYDDSEGDKARKLLDPLARMTRMLWAAWRDRAALNTRPQADPIGLDVEAMIRAVLPGGYSCDPQQVADAIRAYMALRPQAVPMTEAWLDDAMRLADAYADASFDQGLNQRIEDPNPEANREKLAEHLRGITAQAKGGA